MMRPATAKSRLSKGTTVGKDSSKTTTNHGSSTDMGMSVSGKEMTTSANALPKYRGLRMTIDDDNETAGTTENAGKFERDSKHHSQRHPQLGVAGKGTQPSGSSTRQKKTSVTRRQESATTKAPQGATSGFGVRSAAHGKATPTPGATKGLKKSDSRGGLHTSGVSLTKLAASGKNNTDILSQLGSS